jgi:anti-sigma B factor antagonist
MAVDMSQLDFVDSSALGAFITCLRRAKSAGGDIKMFSMTKSVRVIFELVRFHRIIDIFNDREEAVKAFQC